MQSNPNTNIIPKPKIRAPGINLRIPLPELIQGKTRICINGPAALAILNEMEILAVAHDSRHLGRRARRGLGWFRGGGGGCGAGDVHADVVV